MQVVVCKFRRLDPVLELGQILRVFWGELTISSIRDRASSTLPAVILTLLSIIQAIALDMLWQQSFETVSFETTITPMMITGWLQAGATLLILIMVWMTFVGLIMRFVWAPALLDTALPFLVGILQFAIIEVTRPDRLGLWLIGLGALMCVITAISQRYYKRARLDPLNAEFFQKVSPATWRDLLPQFLASALLFLAGGLVLSFDLGAGVAMLSVLIVILSLGYFLSEQNKYWVRSVPTASLKSSEDDPSS